MLGAGCPGVDGAPFSQGGFTRLSRAQQPEPSKYSHSPTVRKGVVVPLLERRLGRVRDYAGVSPADPLKPPVSPWRARSLRSGVEG